jgi:hypothetical protein
MVTHIPVAILATAALLGLIVMRVRRELARRADESSSTRIDRRAVTNALRP